MTKLPLVTIFLILLAIISCDFKTKKPGPNDQSYITENVSFFNTKDNIKIRGTLTYPIIKGPFPFIVLVPGSGQSNRDGSENGRLRPLYEIADYLTKNGMAVLRCDKRGVGESSGTLDFNTTFDDLVSDITASIDYVKQRREYDKSNLGLIGYSYGGIIAAQASIERPEISFAVMMGSPGLKNGQILYQQIGDIARSFRITDITILKFQEIINQTSKILNSNENPDRKCDLIESMYKNKIAYITENEIKTIERIGYRFSSDPTTYSKGVTTPYWYEFYTLDPHSILSEVKCPLFSIIGEKDLQVRPEFNQPAIEDALKSTDNNNYTIMTPLGYNHLFQKTVTGSPDEYEKNTKTISPIILDIIRTWISKRINPVSKTK